MGYKIRTIILACLILGLTKQVQSQTESNLKPISTSYFLQNCNVIQQPGILLPAHSILIKDGMIVEVGKKIIPPFDAILVKADSLYVYAGFIDAYSYTGTTEPDKKNKPNVADPGNPPNDIVGIMPQIRAVDQFKSSTASVSEMREQGFGLSNVVPQGHVLPGFSDLFLLGDGSADQLLLKPKTAQNLRLNPVRGAYPSTVMGVMAKFRKLYRNAQISEAHNQQFNALNTGISRPNYSEDLNALYPITTGKLPLYFYASNSNDIYKALKLKNELGFDMILTEVKQGWYYMDDLKRTNQKILLSLDLPKVEKKKEKEKATKSDEATNKYQERKDTSIQNYLTQAAQFEKANIPFGFSYLEVKTKDIKKNIHTLVSHGLSENAALAALTTYPAQILGISRIAGSIEKGKIANLVIIDKSYFDEKSSILYVFVDGKKYDYTKKSKGKDNGDNKDHNYEGTWSYTIEIPSNTQTGKMTILRKDSEYHITIQNDALGESIENENVSTDGNQLSFSINITMGQSMQVDFDLKMEEDAFSGSVYIAEYGSFPIKGLLLNKPE